jgi:hypothetical protein
MLSFGLGMAVSGFVWFSADFIRILGAVFWSAITGIAIYPVLRDAKSLADAVGPNQTTDANGCGSINPTRMARNGLVDAVASCPELGCKPEVTGA